VIPVLIRCESCGRLEAAPRTFGKFTRCSDPMCHLGAVATVPRERVIEEEDDDRD
jgi:hypothetical protein